MTAADRYVIILTVRAYHDPPEESKYAPFTARAIVIIRSIPRGKVASYAMVATLAGSPLAARQVVRVLHTLSRVEKLPWHRVINSKGAIALRKGAGFEDQKRLLIAEGVKVGPKGQVSLEKYRWRPRLDSLP